LLDQHIRLENSIFGKALDSPFADAVRNEELLGVCLRVDRPLAASIPFWLMAGRVGEEVPVLTLGAQAEPSFHLYMVELLQAAVAGEALEEREKLHRKL
jgi:hypothetical protein